MASGQSAELRAKITLLDGATRTMKFEGVGCSASICSRTVLKGKSGQDAMVTTPFDSIATIKDATSHDALFIMRDGSQRRISLVTDFRVLYLTSEAGATERVDLAKVKSVEFLAP
jgi:NifU-like protein involved in Fe-S cluster formation